MNPTVQSNIFRSIQQHNVNVKVTTSTFISSLSPSSSPFLSSQAEPWSESLSFWKSITCCMYRYNKIYLFIYTYMCVCMYVYIHTHIYAVFDIYVFYCGSHRSGSTSSSGVKRHLPAEDGGAGRVVLLGRRLGFTVRQHRLSGGSGESRVTLDRTGPDRFCSRRVSVSFTETRLNDSNCC